MKIDRLTRVNELLKREIGTALFHIISDGRFDPAAVTITSVSTSSDLRDARVMVSISGNDRVTMLDIIKEKRVEIQKIINKNLKLKYTPRLSFHIDTSIEKGDHVLKILYEIESQSGNEDAELEDTTE